MLTGYKSVCGRNDGGVVSVHLVPVQSVKEVTLDTTKKAVTAITLEAGAKFVEYEFGEDTCEFRENGTFENNAYSVEQALQFKLTAMNEESRTAVEEIAEASYCGLLGVVRLPNGEARVMGYSEIYNLRRPVRLQSAEGTTGQAFTDEHGEDVTVGSIQPSKALSFTGDVETLPE